MNRCIVSANSLRQYAWYGPLTALAWQEIAGMKVTVICIGDVEPLLMSKVVEAGGEVVHVNALPGRNTAALAQLCRLYAAAHPTYANDYLMTTDIDAWPLQSAPFQPSGREIDIYAAGGWPVFPIGYIGAQAATWRAFMGITDQSIEAALARAFESEPGIGDGFNIDEALVTWRIANWLQPGLWRESGGHPAGTIAAENILRSTGRGRVVRRPGGDCPVDRIYFGRWPDPVPANMTDAHLCSRLHHPTWAQLRSLLVGRVSDRALAWADDYERTVPHYVD